MILLISMTVFMAVILAASAVASLRVDPVRGRLATFSHPDPSFSYQQSLSRPLLEKVLFPLLQWLGRWVGRYAPGHVIGDIDRRLRQAGNPMGLSVNDFLLAKAALFVGLPVAYGVWIFVGGRGQVSLVQLVALAGLFLVGYRGPDYWLDRKVASRKQEINQSLPDALDLIVICSEAGLALEGAMTRVTERLQGPLADELRRTLGEISLGKRRRDALRDLADRTEAVDLVGFIAAVVQADQTGISVGNVLRIQADDLRLRRRQRAEKEGRQAPMKMLFPNILFIFPATLIVLIGPAVLTVVERMLASS
jgi:tight adherence protein C